MNLFYIRKFTGFSLIEIVVSILLFSILSVIIFPLIYLFVDISETTSLKNKSNILLNNSVSEMSVVSSDSIAGVNGLFLVDDYKSIENYDEFKREIYVYNEKPPDTTLKRIHIITKYYVSEGLEEKNETVFLR